MFQSSDRNRPCQTSQGQGLAPGPLQAPKTNILTTITDHLFGPIAALRTVDFGHNQIVHIDEAIYNKSEVLILDNNPIENLNLTAIAESDKLLDLTLNSTYFQFPEHWPEQQTANRSSKLVNLKLSMNNITKQLVIFSNIWLCLINWKIYFSTIMQ